MTKKVVLIFIIALSIGCTKREESDVNSKAVPFNNIDPKISGIDFSNDLKPNGSLNIIE
jgi:hypothetical protein